MFEDIYNSCLATAGQLTSKKRVTAMIENLEIKVKNRKVKVYKNGDFYAFYLGQKIAAEFPAPPPGVDFLEWATGKAKTTLAAARA